MRSHLLKDIVPENDTNDDRNGEMSSQNFWDNNDFSDEWQEWQNFWPDKYISVELEIGERGQKRFG